ncbi:hypothetical protein [Pseudoalteromonas rubra]|uniref:Uncharacterized protein n=1 Tax=Pseudoalteromonas rubra TaxID=43658 RepID=A0A0U3I4J4_9GAMM|nr:hypothetical protein [Pseudoalteromonas rubra]ALU42815.1 hypothetical protein AT705_07535 [Pseudoalteromonas rubra]
MIDKILGFALLFMLLGSFFSVLGNLLATLMNPVELKVVAWKRFGVSLLVLLVTFIIAYHFGYFIDKYEWKN